MKGKRFVGELNIEPPLCGICGAKHEPEYPHLDTAQFRRHVFREKGRVATQYDLLAHTTGALRESVMVAKLQEMVVR